MRRPDTLATVGAALARALVADPPAWASPATLRAAEALLRAIRIDLRFVSHPQTVRAAAKRAGVGLGTWVGWTGPGGWLAAREGEHQIRIAAPK
jgi:hypothetical protein